MSSRLAAAPWTTPEPSKSSANSSARSLPADATSAASTKSHSSNRKSTRSPNLNGSRERNIHESRHGSQSTNEPAPRSGGPGNRGNPARRSPPPVNRHRAYPLGKPRFGSRPRSHGLDLHQQVRRGLPREALLRRLRIRG